MSSAEHLLIENSIVPSEGPIFAEGPEVVEAIKAKLESYVHLNPRPLTSEMETVCSLGINASIHPFRVPEVEDPYSYVANLVEVIKSTVHIDDSSASILKKVLYTLVASHKEPTIDLVREMVEEEATYLTGTEYMNVRRLESVLTDMTVGTFGSAMKEERLELQGRALVTIPDEFPVMFRYVPLAIVLLRLMYMKLDTPVILSDVEGYVPSRSNVLREERAVMFERVSSFMRLFDILSRRRTMILLQSTSSTLVASEVLMNSRNIILRRPRTDQELRILEGFGVQWERLSPNDAVVLSPTANIFAKRFKIQSVRLEEIKVPREIAVQYYSIQPILKRLFGGDWEKAADILKFVRDSQPVNLESLEAYAETKFGKTKTLRTLISVGMVEPSKTLMGLSYSLTKRGEKAIAEIQGADQKS